VPSVSAYGKVFRKWERVIGAVNENLSRIPGVEPMRDEAVAILEEARALKVQQENLEGLRQAATQRLKGLVDDGSVKIRQLQSLVKAYLGPRSEQLPQFGVTPNRKRSDQPKRKKPEAPGNPPAPPTPADDPAVVVKAAE
jgi:hypothetical protein